MRKWLIGCLALAASVGVRADEGWQTLQVDLADAGGQKKQCQMKVPAGWKLQEKGATSGDEFSATLVFEAEKPEVWWAKRKKFDFKDSRMLQDTKTNYWVQVMGAFMSNSPDGTTYIAGVRDGDLVCHIFLEFKADGWPDKYAEFEKKYGDVIREMVVSMKPMQ
jgi:hypothetical protein